MEKAWGTSLTLVPLAWRPVAVVYPQRAVAICCCNSASHQDRVSSRSVAGTYSCILQHSLPECILTQKEDERSAELAPTFFHSPLSRLERAPSSIDLLTQKGSGREGTGLLLSWARPRWQLLVWSRGISCGHIAGGWRTMAPRVFLKASLLLYSLKYR